MPIDNQVKPRTNGDVQALLVGQLMEHLEGRLSLGQLVRFFRRKCLGVTQDRYSDIAKISKHTLAEIEADRYEVIKLDTINKALRPLGLSMQPAPLNLPNFQDFRDKAYQTIAETRAEQCRLEEERKAESLKTDEERVCGLFARRVAAKYPLDSVIRFGEGEVAKEYHCHLAVILKGTRDKENYIKIQSDLAVMAFDAVIDLGAFDVHLNTYAVWDSEWLNRYSEDSQLARDFVEDIDKGGITIWAAEKKKMRPSEALALYRDEIVRVVEANKTTNPRVFGSVLHGTDTEDSDLDILVDTKGKTTLFDIGKIRADLIDLLGVEVDIVTADSVPEKHRNEIINKSRPL